MSKMYLIRRENTKFIGPLTKVQFREGLRKMDFGLQDEVCGHCGTWVVIDRQEAMNRYYPELAAIVAEELPAAWREMTGHARKMTQNEKRTRPHKSKSSSKSSSKPSGSRKVKPASNRSQVVFISSVLVALVAFGVGYWIKLQDELQVPGLGEIPQLSMAADPNGFLNEMGLRIPPVVGKINKNKEVQNTWLPYLRMYAFYTSGSIDGVPLKLIKGNVSSSAPADCSVEAWKKKWQEFSPQLPLFVAGKAMAKNSWSKALSWDPYWIKRRPSKGWIKPKNWYDGCLMSASVAMRSISENLGNAEINGITKEMIAIVIRRLQTQLEILQDIKQTNSLGKGSFLDALSCLDLAADLVTLKSCKIKFNEEQFDQAIEERYFWQLTRMVMDKPSVVLDKEFQNELTSIALKVQSEENLTKLDYSAELGLIKELIQSGFKIEGFNNRIAFEFSEGKIKP